MCLVGFGVFASSGEGKIIKRVGDELSSIRDEGGIKFTTVEV